MYMMAASQRSSRALQMSCPMSAWSTSSISRLLWATSHCSSHVECSVACSYKQTQAWPAPSTPDRTALIICLKIHLHKCNHKLALCCTSTFISEHSWRLNHDLIQRNLEIESCLLHSACGQEYETQEAQQRLTHFARVVQVESASEIVSFFTQVASFDVMFPNEETGCCC